MAETVVPSSLEVTQWERKFYKEWVRDNRFRKYMGLNMNSIIQIKEDLTKKKGDNLIFQLVNKLKNNGVIGNGILEGNEEAMDSDGYSVGVTYRRNAVVQTLEEEQASTIDYLNAARFFLKKWRMERVRDDIIVALCSISDKYYLASQAGLNPQYTAQVSEAEKDTWLAANADRVLFGSAVSNNSANDHSASLANIDNTNDKLTPAVGSLAKRLAKKTTPAIHPVTVKDEQEWYVMFCNSNSFRDLQNDSTMTQANREAMKRGRDNPLFTDGDLVYDSVIYREVPEIPAVGLVGAGSIQVGFNFLCGVQACGMAVAKRTKAISDDRDYKFRKGVGIQDMGGIKKLLYNDPDNSGSDVDHGLVTVYTASVDDV